MCPFCGWGVVCLGVRWCWCLPVPVGLGCPLACPFPPPCGKSCVVSSDTRAETKGDPFPGTTWCFLTITVHRQRPTRFISTFPPPIRPYAAYRLSSRAYRLSSRARWGCTPTYTSCIPPKPKRWYARTHANPSQSKNRSHLLARSSKLYRHVLQRRRCGVRAMGAGPSSPAAGAMRAVHSYIPGNKLRAPRHRNGPLTHSHNHLRIPEIEAGRHATRGCAGPIQYNVGSTPQQALRGRYVENRSLSYTLTAPLHQS